VIDAGHHRLTIEAITIAPPNDHYAFHPLPLDRAKVSSPNRQRSLGLGRGKRAISSTVFVERTTYVLASRLRASSMKARVTKVFRRRR
jgi:hypothetical protein